MESFATSRDAELIPIASLGNAYLLGPAKAGLCGDPWS
jgi:hypothetical protein